MPLFWLSRFWLLCILLSAALITTAHAQAPTPSHASPDNWSVGRIFIPAESQQTRIPEDYWPIEISELEAKLQIIDEQRRRLKLDPPQISHAVYLATVNRELLVSDASYWRFAGIEPEKPFEIGKVNIALKDAKGMPVEERQLSQAQRFNGDGSIALVNALANEKYWFGFQAAASPKNQRQQFELVLPRASQAVMLVSADHDTLLSSEDAIVHPVVDALAELPEELWPIDLQPKPNARQRWWSIQLSGLSRFTLQVQQSNAPANANLIHALTSSKLTYRLERDSVVSQAAFQFASSPGNQPVQLMVRSPNRIRTLSVSGRQINWKAVPGDVEASLIQIPSTSITAGNTVEVQCICNLAELSPIQQQTLDQSGDSAVVLNLPPIEIVGSYAIAGTSQIECSGAYIASRIESKAKFQQFRSSELIRDSSPVWRAQWTGVQPEVTVSRSAKRESWLTESCCKLMIRSSTIQAQLVVSLSGKDLQSNSVQLDGLTGWNIEQVRVVSSSPSEVQSNLASSVQRDSIVLDWVGGPNQIDAQIEVQATRTFDQQISSLCIENPRVIVAPGDAGPIVYQVFSTGGHRLKSSPTLLSMRVVKKDLPSWQQALIVDDNVPLFRDWATASDSSLCLESAVAEYSAQLTAMVNRVDKRRLGLKTLITVTPITGSIDSLPILFPDESTRNSWHFSISSNSSTREQLPVSIHFHESNPNIGIVQLPSSSSDVVHIIGETELMMTDDDSADSFMPILGVVGATESESLVLIPNQLANLAKNNDVEVLSSIDCCPKLSFEFWQRELLHQSDLESNWTAIRVDGFQAHTVGIRNAQTPNTAGWIWNESLNHQILSTGLIRHTLELDFQSGQSPLMVDVPNDWDLIRLTVNNQSQDAAPDDQHRIPIVVNSARRSQVSAEFVSRVPALEAFEKLRIACPSYDVAVLHSHRDFQLSPSHVPFYSGSLETQFNLRRMLRSPQSIWSVLAPDHDFAQPENKAGWGTYAITSSNRSVIEVLAVNRQTLAAIFLAALIGMAGLSWWIINYSQRLWWIATICALLVCILNIGASSIPACIVLLGLLLGSIAKLTSIVLKPPRQHFRPTSLSSRQATTGLLLLIAISSTGFGQNPLQRESDAVEERIFGIIVPYESDTSTDTGYAYIPKELRDLLPDTGANIATQPIPKILSANYVMRMRQNPPDMVPLHDFSAELRILATDANGQLLLPFEPSSLRLVSASLNGQPKLLGARTFEIAEDDSGIIFRPDSTGVLTVTLQFQTVIDPAFDQQFEFAASIPPVPNAVLRIVPSSQTSGFTTNALGGLQRSLSGEFQAMLGAIDTLKVQWTENDRSTTTGAYEYSTETWVNAVGENLSIACQLTLERGRSGSEEFDLFLDPDWHPVGTAWGDAELISSSITTGLRRRVIRLRLRDDTGPVCSFRMLLAPVANSRSTTVEVPFLSLDRVVSKGKTLWWSSSGSMWSLDGIETLPLKMPADNWGVLQLSNERIGYTNVSAGIKLRLIPSNIETCTYLESTSLHLYKHLCRIEFDAILERVPLALDKFTFDFPKDFRVTNVEINGRSETFRTLAAGNVEVASRSFLSAGFQIHFDLESAPSLGHLEYLPRLQVQDWLPRQASYQVLRGPELSVELLPNNSGLDFTVSPIVARRSTVDELETLVGETNLPTELLNDNQLHAPLDVVEHSAEAPDTFVQYLTQDEDGWKGTVRATWRQSAKGVEYAYFDVPVSLRDNIDVGTQVCVFKPHEDDSRSNLLIPLPRADETQNVRTVEFSFPISEITSARSISLPRIVSHVGKTLSPVIALPKVINGHQVQWIRSGSKVLDSWLSDWKLDVHEFDFFEQSQGLNKLTWQSSDARQLYGEIDLAWVDLTSGSSEQIAGVVNYWLLPRNQITQSFLLQHDCKILGVECDNRPTTWSVAGEELRVALRPNTLPLSLRIMVQWRLPGSKTTDLQLPKPISAEISGPVLVNAHAIGSWQVDDPSLQKNVSLEPMVDRWSSVVLSAARILSNLDQAQAERWLGNWRPGNYSLRRDRVIAASALQSQLAAYDLNDDGEVTVGELWDRVVALSGTERDHTATTTSSADAVDLTLPQWIGTKLSIKASRQLTAAHQSNSAWPEILAVLTIGLTGFWLGPTIKVWSLKLLSLQPWIFWLFLAVMLWISLPVPWPSYLVTMIAIWIAISQMLEGRRRSRKFGFD